MAVLRKLFLLLLLAQLACLQSVTPASEATPQPSPTATPEITQHEAVGSIESTTPTKTVQQCAQVTAVLALNVRNDKHKVIGHVYYGERVQVITDDGDWWQIQTPEISGQVRSKYLMECE